jgi:RNA polymerase sigma-70 factor, ECF subfamily
LPKAQAHPVEESRTESSATAAERALVARIRLGDDSAFEVLYRNYYQALYEFALGYAQSHADAEEVAQDVLCNVWEHREQWEIRSSVRAYLYAAIRHRVLNTLRQARVRETFAATFGGEAQDPDENETVRGRDATDAPVPGMGVPPIGPDEALSRTERAAALREAIGRLPARRREVLMLRWERGLSYAEIAQVIKSTARNVEQAHYRSVKALRRLLSGIID